ncbi:MAG TPA: hypothetical protein VL282_16025 [Tepidisphaeraceae bacterium]|jgi:hypothetical protein|nr:hypothetical protein [Tepidisphaeraceae bacterium]
MLYSTTMTPKPDQDARDPAEPGPPAELVDRPAGPAAPIPEPQIRVGIPDEDQFDLCENLQRSKSDQRRTDVRLIAGTIVLVAFLGALIFIGRAIYLRIGAERKATSRPTASSTINAVQHVTQHRL